MQIDNIRLGQQSRDQLVRLKRITGIEHWNVLCRWALCLSLSDKNPPPRTKIVGEAAVEMNWKTFAGEYADIYSALLVQRAHDDGRTVSREVLSELTRTHITRGIGLLTARREMAGISSLLRITPL